MISAVAMGAGALIWLIGELWAVTGHGQPTTYYVRHFQTKYPWVRLLMWLFLAWLCGHFEFGLL